MSAEIAISTPPPSAWTIWRDAWRVGYAPEPALTISEWADRHRVLSSRNAAEPGRWRTSRTPYLRAIQDALSPSDPHHRVVFMKSSQIGGTEAGNNFAGYIVHQAPGPTMVVMPSLDMARRTSRQRLDPLFEESPALRGLVGERKGRDASNSCLMKTFPGGLLVITGANSAAGLRSMPVRYLFLDEIDAFPADIDGEGDPISLAVERTNTFSRRKIFYCSTPTVSGRSRIDALFQESDQRRYFVPCPHCGEEQHLEWSQLRWPAGKPRAAEYVCRACGCLIDHRHKRQMLEIGCWIAAAEGDGVTAGFAINALYSPWLTWGDLAARFVAAEKIPERLKVFVNTALGEPWAERGEAPSWQRLADRRADRPPGRVPNGVLILTAGADVQRDRVEMEIVGWGPRGESWSIDYRVVMGDPHREETWLDVDEIIKTHFPREGGGALPITRLAIDSGYATTSIYRFARRKPQQIMAIKGDHRLRVTVGQPATIDLTVGGKRSALSVKLWPAGVDLLKHELYGRLNLERPEDPALPLPAGWCHFAAHNTDEFFRQLTAEQLVTRRRKGGYTHQEWRKTRDRNEALDCRIYAMAAAEALGLSRRSDDWWLARRAELDVIGPEPTAPAPINRPRRPTVARSNYLGG